MKFLDKFISIFEAKNNLLLKILFTLGFLLLLVYFFPQSYFYSGGWGINESISMADCAKIGEGYYSTPEAGYRATFVYFPGVAFIARLAGLISYENRSIIMLAISSFVGVLFWFMLAQLSNKIGSKPNISYLFALAYAIFSFRSYRFFMLDFKPDTLLLLLTIFAIFIFVKISENKNLIINYALLFLLMFAIGILKQQSIVIYLSLGLSALLFIKDKKNKLLTLLFTTLAGLATLSVVLLIPNCYEFAVTLVSRHNIEKPAIIFKFFRDAFRDLILFIIPSIVYFINFVMKKERLNIYGKSWLIVSLFWLCASFISTCKAGGTWGNVEVGLVVLFPFVACVLSKYLKDNKFVKFAQIVFLIVIFVSLGFKIQKYFRLYTEKNNENSVIINYLKENYAGKSALYCGDVYMELSKAEVLPTTDVFTAIGYRFKPGGTDIFYKSIRDKKYDLVYCNSTLQKLQEFDPFKKYVNAVEKDYKFLEKSNMPDVLKGKILIRK